MKKPTIILATAVLTFFLTGCTSIKDYVDSEIIRQSGVIQDQNHEKYVSYLVSGQLDDEGKYNPPADSAIIEHEPIHVTFSNNKRLNVQYFTDSTLNSAIDASSCYFSPGDSIYAKVAVSENEHNNLYSFSGFRVYAYDNERKAQQVGSVTIVENENGYYVLTIPEQFEYSEVSIEPIGSYSKRTLTLNDYFIDDNNQTHSLSGKWTVNKETCSSGSIEINPVVPYLISYKYDSNEYFYVSSNPECHYINNADGEVIFKERKPEDKTEDYNVELHKYLTVTLISAINRTVRIDAGEPETVNANTEFQLRHLKYGDTVELITDKAWPGLENNVYLGLRSYENLTNNEHKYTLFVPEKGGEFEFDPSDYQYKNGEIVFKYLGKPITSPIQIPRERTIYYEQASADYGYWLPGNAEDHKIIIGEKGKTEAAIRAIHFTPKVKVRVALPQPKAGGMVIYKLDGKDISEDNSVTAYSGSVISMELKKWEGWMLNTDNKQTYVIKEGYDQTVEFKTGDVNTLFTEDENHKPAFSVNLEKNIGKSTNIAIEASGFDKETKRYTDRWGTQTVIKDRKIGTDKPILISMSGRAIPSGKAIRITVVKTTSENKKETETYYTDLSKPIDPIYIYPNGTNQTSKKWYKTVDISVEEVEIEKIIPVQPGPNTKLEIVDTSTRKTYKVGDYVEASHKVTITISPNDGYHLTGDKIVNGKYIETMKYSDFRKKIASIITSHPAARDVRVWNDE